LVDDDIPLDFLLEESSASDALDFGDEEDVELALEDALAPLAVTVAKVVWVWVEPSVLPPAAGVV